MHISADALGFHLDIDIARRPAAAAAPGLMARLSRRMPAIRSRREERWLDDLSRHDLHDIGLREDELRESWAKDPLMQAARTCMSVPFWPSMYLDRERDDRFR